jgi:hypothetical protein
MKNHARLRQFIADFTRVIETCGDDEPIPVIPNFLDHAADVRAMRQKTV